MRWILDSSIRFGRLFVALAAGLMVFGVAQLRTAPTDVYPEFLPPGVEIQTEALGLSAQEVEQLITVPLEQDLLNGVPWLQDIHSTSRAGLSDIQLTFEPGTNLYAARQMVQERMTQAHALPNVGSPPIMVQPLASASRVAMIGLSSKSVSLIDMSVLARWKLRPRLMGVPGVANVSVYGQRDQQLQLQVDPQRLAANGVSLTQVIESAGNALWVSPLTFVEASTPGTGGFVEGPNQRLSVQHNSPITNASTLADVPIDGAAKSGTVKLGDVADVVVDHQPLIGDAVSTGDPSLYLVIEKFPGADTIAVTRGVEEAMAQMAPGLPNIAVDTHVYRPASYLESALRNLGWAGGLALGAMVLVMLLVLGSWRAAVVGLVAVPVSLTAATYVLYLRGTPLTTITALGLAAALTLVVDDVVSDLTAVRRGDVLGSLLTVRRPLLYALPALALVLVPFLVISPLVSAFAAPLVLTFALAVLASLLVALTVTPTLALLLARVGRPGPASVGPRSRPLDALARRLVPDRARGAAPALAVGAVLALALVAVVPQWGDGTLLPEPQDRQLMLEVQTAEGTSLAETDRITSAMSQELRGLPGITAVGAHVGRAISADQIVNVNSAQIWLTVADGVDYAATRGAIRAVARGYAGVRSSLSTYTADRVAQARAASAHDLVVRVFGSDLTTLQQKASEVRTMLGSVSGLAYVAVEPMPMQPGVTIEVDLAKAGRYGLRPGDVRREATTLTSGLVVGNLYEQAKVFDVVVWGAPGVRGDVTGLGNLLISTPSGTPVRLADVATLKVAPEPSAIVHDDVQRSADVTAQVTGDPATVVDAVQRGLAGIAMPTEYHAEVLGSATDNRADLVRTLAAGGGALLGLLLLFQAAVSGWRRAALMLASLPVSLAGGVLAAFAVGGLWNIGSIAALVAVLALAVRHALLTGVATADDRDDRDGEAGTDRVPATETLRQRSVGLLRTVLIAAAATVPILVLGARPGLEAVHPMAVTLLGGLAGLLVVQAFVLPTLLRALSERSPSVPAPRVATTPTDDQTVAVSA